MDAHPTLTIDELIAYLTHFPHDTKVYISRDEEGNGYGTLSNTPLSTEYKAEDRAIVLFPYNQQLEYDDVFPKAWEKESKE